MPGPYTNIGGYQTRINANDTTQREELGSWRYEAGKVLRYVKASAIIPSGAAVKIDTTVTTAALIGNQVILTIAPTDMCVGIAETTLSALNFGWITCYGPATASVSTQAAAPGQYVGPSSTSGVLAVASTSLFNAAAVALQSGLSAGSAVYVTVL